VPRAGLTPARVTDRAARLADLHGFESLTLGALAADLDVRVPSLYKHVAGLPDLRQRLAVRGMRALGERLTDAIGRAGVPAAALRAMGVAYRRFAAEHPGLYAAALRAPAPGDAELTAAAAAATAPLFAVLARYGLRDDAAVHAARFVRSALHGFATLEAGGGFGLPQDVDESFARLLADLDAALLARAQSSSS
jgi:AcrR family transcriptional regulator